MERPIEAWKDQAMRFNNGKLQWDLVDFESFESMVKVLEFGTIKYKRDNWKKGLPMRAQCNSLMRHLVALFSGEVNDPETGLPHWSHIQCNAMFMAHTMKHHPELNDLPKNGKEEKGNISSDKDVEMPCDNDIEMS